MAKPLIEADNEQHIKAVAEALFNYESRNHGKRFAAAHLDTQYRYIDKASWVLSQAAQEISEGAA
jgi:hypothetical protein